jgi:putative transposase
VSNTYQKNRRRAQPDRQPGEIAVPEQVIVSMAEIAESAKEGLLALAVGTGLQVMAAMFDQDAAGLCGPEGKHNPDRAGYRHGAGAGSVTLGGRRVPVPRPRVRAADGSGELRLPSYDVFSSTEILGQMALEKMLAGLSSRRYSAGLEPAGQAVEEAAAATSKSAVSRRFVAATETALAELMARRLDDLDLIAFMVDGVHFGGHTCVVALGIGIDGTKHPLAVEEGSTENATLVTDLITGLRDRGLDVTKPILAVLDGAKALSRAVKDVFGKPLIHRCQQHRSRKEITCWFSILGSICWYGDLVRGSRSAGVEVRGAAASSERAAAAVAAGGRGPVAGARRGPGSRPVDRGERDHRPQGRVRAGSWRGPSAWWPCPACGRGAKGCRASGSGAGSGVAGAGGAG